MSGRRALLVSRGVDSEIAAHAVALLLRARTADLHARVESGLDLLAPDLSRARLGLVLGRLGGFWAGTEPLVDAWAAGAPELAARLDWRRRRRSAAFGTDHLVLLPGAGSVALVAPPVFPVVGTAEALGWLYVTEGSSLGGAVIERRLRERGLLAPDAPAPRSFVPYPEGPGPMWQSFQRALVMWTSDGAGRDEAVADAARTVFSQLAGWMSPAFARAAA